MAVCKCYACMGDFDDNISICPHCGYEQTTAKAEEYHLDPGTCLENRYLIGKVIGSGGFGVTYVAWDNVLSKKVAVKEYFPSEFATRMVGTTEVCSYDGEKSYQFEAGLKSFVDEALRLAKLNQLDGIVHIYDSFVENCTAYIIMEFVDGVTLKDLLKQNGPLPYQDVIGFVVPVLNALEEVHKEGIIHRDIAPDNIKIHGDKVTLLDFGAARNATTVHSKSLSVIVKPGYAPEEQYRSHGAQGPWTDVYAMAAVMYHLITGKLPDESVERNVKDELKTPSELGFDIPEPLENAIMNALNVKAEYRIQTAKEFADALTGAVVLERVKIENKPAPVEKMPKKFKIAMAIGGVIAVVLMAVILLTTNNFHTFSAEGNRIPDLKGLEEKEVVVQLKEVGLNKNNYQIVGIEEVEGQENKIVWQSIEPHERIGKDYKTMLIELKLGKAQVVEEDEESDEAIMPSLQAMNKNEAIQAMETAGFTNYTFSTRVTNQTREGLVCDQSLSSGETVKKDTLITIYIAKNEVTTAEKEDEDKNDIDNFFEEHFNKTEKETEKVTEKETVKPTEKETQKAPEKLTQKETEKVTQNRPAPSVPPVPHTQAPQTQAPTTTLPPPTTEKLFTVPNVMGMTEGAATNKLNASGVRYSITYGETTTDINKKDVVYSVTYSAGAQVTSGEKVYVYIYKYVEE